MSSFSTGGAVPTGKEEVKTLWIGDVEPWMDETWLATIFNEVAVPVNAKIIRDRGTGLPAGYGFVEFGTHQAAQKILDSLNGQIIPGTTKRFRLNWASFGIGQSRPSSQEYSMFVGDLDLNVNDYTLGKAFASRYKSISGTKVIFDASGLSRGYGFVRFTDKDECDKAMKEMQGTYLGSKPIRCSVATQKKQMLEAAAAAAAPGSFLAAVAAAAAAGSGGGSSHPSLSGVSGVGLDLLGVGGDGGAAAAAAAAVAAAAANSNNLVVQAALRQQLNTGSMFLNPAAGMGFDPTFDLSANTVFVGGLDPTINEEQLAQYFAPFGAILSCKITSQGCGFVTFFDRTQGQSAINHLDGATIGSNAVRVHWKVGAENASISNATTMQAKQQMQMFNSPTDASSMQHPMNQLLYDSEFVKAVHRVARRQREAMGITDEDAATGTDSGCILEETNGFVVAEGPTTVQQDITIYPPTNFGNLEFGKWNDRYAQSRMRLELGSNTHNMYTLWGVHVQYSEGFKNYLPGGSYCVNT
eukprot:Filipodium_phascolosomae@DN2223_c0_g1_i1.p1